MDQTQESQIDKTSNKKHLNAPSLSDFALKEETRMRWFVLCFAAVLSLILISADLVFAFLNHNLFALVPSPLIATFWIPMVRHLFPGRSRIPKGTSR